VLDLRATERGLGWAHFRKEQPMPPTTVLVVEDMKSVRELLREVLGLYGYAVLTAASVPEAEAIRQRVGWGAWIS
jgi:DNA-binding NtrC family response regulator